MLAREGESLDLQKIAPDPIPDQENFFAIPPLKDLAISSGKDDDKSELGLKLTRLMNAFPLNNRTPGRPSLSPETRLGEPADLKAWADWLRKDGTFYTPNSKNPARDVLAALARDDDLVNEMAVGLTRPESQWTPAWKNRILPTALFMLPIPYYAPMQRLDVMLCLRCTAAARAGDAEKAHKALLIGLRINQAFTKEPILIGALLGCGLASLNASATWELCDSHAGTAYDFRTLQDALSRLDFRASYLYAERGEMAAGINSVEYAKSTCDPMLLSVVNGLSEEHGTSLGSALLKIVPGGWFDGNAASLAQWQLDYAIIPMRDGGFPDLVEKQKELREILSNQKHRFFFGLNDSLALFIMPAVQSVTYKTIYAQSLVNQAAAACALERYRIEYGAYPDKLEAANRTGEKSIPPDVLTGKPMGYRKTADGRYVLWCAGFSGTDHGGKRVLDAHEPQNTKFADPKYAGDWVWDYPKEWTN